MAHIIHVAFVFGFVFSMTGGASVDVAEIYANQSSPETWNCVRYAFQGVDSVCQLCNYAMIQLTDHFGTINQNAVREIRDALAANLVPDGYMFPCYNCNTTAQQQVAATIDFLVQNNVFANRIWVVVDNPSTWSSQPADNVAFINAFMGAMSKSTKSPGIVAESNNWTVITGNTDSCNQYPLLWNSQAYDCTYAASFQYTEFGSWKTANARICKVDSVICGTLGTRYIYDCSSFQCLVPTPFIQPS